MNFFILDYKGCYSSPKVFNYSILPDYAVKPVDCKPDCKKCGYRYAVLHVKLCACMDFLDGMVKVNETLCPLRCFTNENIACGGQNGSTNLYTIYGRFIHKQ